MAKNTNYGADQIQVLEGLDPVRKRPGMYIGSTGQAGLHHLVTEIVNNSMDEAMAGFANHIRVEFFKDGSVAVYDNGRGIPYGKKAGYNVSALELVFTKLHAGGKFGGGGYKVASGLHGVGSSVVNALSSWLRVVVKNEDEMVFQEYADGGKVTGPVAKHDPKKPVTKIKGEEWNLDASSWPYETGTIVQFKPDPTIFETVDFKFKHFVGQLREYAYLTAKIKFELIDRRTDEAYSFYFEGGVQSYVQALNRNKKILHNKIFHVRKELDNVEVEVAMQYTDAYVENVLTFANHIRTAEDGTHLTGFRSAQTRVFNDYARKQGYLKEKDQNLSGDDIKEGLTAIVSVKLESDKIQFEGQTKGKLGNSHVRAAVETITKEALEMYFEENPSDAQQIIQKNLLTLKARMAAKAARETVIRKTAMEGGGVLPGKLADCAEKDPEKAELFIVEGDSAGGCFSGDTLIALADGRNVSFDQIVKEQSEGKAHFCYTVQNNGDIAIEKFINARVTKRNTSVVQITLDNNEQIICTPDHKFMLRDGTYKAAQDLLVTDSLMPLYRKLSSINDKGITIDGYEMVWNPNTDKWIFTHLLADAFNIRNKTYDTLPKSHKHHIDFNKNNNDPTNIVQLSKEAHLELHKKHAKLTLGRPDVMEKSKKIRQTLEFKEKMSALMNQPHMKDMLSKRAKKQWANNEYKTYMIAKWKEFYKANAAYRQKNTNQLNKLQKTYWNNAENRTKQSEKVRAYFENNPQARKQAAQVAKNQWKNAELLNWRKETTKKQWTQEFRKKRLDALQKTYYNKTIAALKLCTIDNEIIDIEMYKTYKTKKKDKSLLKFETFCNRYFYGDSYAAIEAVKNYNHKIAKIERLETKIDVYDAEVPNSHNFALASGVFVHNSAKQGRDRDTQAILPLFGKVLNTERARIDKIVESDKFKNLILAIGTGIGESYDPSKLRYHKLIIMADADSDGYHIATLYLTFFYRHMKELIEEGYIYIAAPPLFKATWGKEKKYLADERELNSFKKTTNGQKALIQRFKGLGEMNEIELWETTMNPETRILKQVTVDDASMADEIFTTLMGSEVAPRKKFIMTHAKDAEVDLI